VPMSGEITAVANTAQKLIVIAIHLNEVARDGAICDS
jgi:hypothetical protein